MKRLSSTIFAFLIILLSIKSFAANTKGWLGVTTGKGIKTGAPGIKLLEHADAPTNAALADGVIYADTDNNLYYRAGGAWVDLTVQGGGSLTLDGAFDNGKIINGADSAGNAMQVGDGTDAILIHTEAAGDVQITTNGSSDLTIAPDGGDTTVTGTLTSSGALTVSAGGATIAAGGVSVTLGGIDVDAGGLAVAGGVTVEDTGLTIDAGGLTVSAGGASVIGGLSGDAMTLTGDITTSTGDFIASAGEADISGGASNEDLIDIIRHNSASGGRGIHVNMGTAAVAGDGYGLEWGGAGTGDGFSANMANNLAGTAFLASVAGVRVDDTVKLTSTSTGADNLIGAYLNGAATGKVVNIDMNLGITAVGYYLDNGGTARTGADFQVEADSTGAHSVIDIDDSGSGATTGFDFQGSYNGSPAGDAVAVTLDDGDNLDTGLLNFSVGTGNRNSLITYTSTGTDSGTTSYVYDHTQSGILDSAFWRLEYDTAASTGDGSFYEMGTNVAGRAIVVDTSATGVDNEGAAFHVAADGALVQGANLLRIESAGNMAHADTRIVEIIESGADQASSYTIDITSTNNGGIILSSGSTDHAIDITQGIVDLNGNKIEFFDAAVGIYSQADTFLDIFADGALRIGDSSAGAPTNYSNFSATGTLTFAGSARLTKKVWLGSEVFKNQSGSTEGVSGTGFKHSWEMTDGAAEYVTTSWYIPDNWVAGTDILAYVHWATPTTSQVGTWDLHYVAIAETEDTQGAGTDLADIDDTSDGTTYRLNITTVFTIANGDLSAGDQIILRPGRVGNAGNDTLGDIADFLGVQLAYTANKP